MPSPGYRLNRSKQTTNSFEGFLPKSKAAPCDHHLKTVRIFSSSTFRDMHAERDHLVKIAFPALRESLLKDGIYLDDIDMRWGVTGEQAENDRVLDLYLQQIDECRPFFLGILGERYGWVPLKISSNTCRNVGWIRETHAQI